MNPIAEIFIYAAFGCALAALILLRRQANWAVWAMVLAAGSTALGAALLDPFLNVWDEQFHALVAKNFTHHWWVPTLFDTPVLSYDYRNWVGNHIWLHKQPLFLWQIAGSIKLFGTSPLAVRLPSVLMHALTSYFIYGIGTRTMNMRVGILAGLLCAFMYFPLELVVGGYATDHNDTAFLCYVTGAFWAALNYEETRQTKWLWVLGVFSGAAVLIKWLMGLIALLIWGISGLFTAPRKIWANAVPQLGAFGIAVILFLPWQVYTWMTFPEES